MFPVNIFSLSCYVFSLSTNVSPKHAVALAPFRAALSMWPSWLIAFTIWPEFGTLSSSQIPQHKHRTVRSVRPNKTTKVDGCFRRCQKIDQKIEAPQPKCLFLSLHHTITLCTWILD